MERDNIETSSVWGLSGVQEKSTHLYILFNILQILRVFPDNSLIGIKTYRPAKGNKNNKRKKNRN